MTTHKRWLPSALLGGCAFACLTGTLLAADPVPSPAASAGGEVPLNFVRAPGPVTIDGALSDWVLTAPVSYEVDASAADRTVRTYAMWDDQNLYLAYVVRDASPMQNGGDDPSSAFKSGDSLHFYLGTGAETVSTKAAGGPHDFHVLMTLQRGKPVIFAFRQQKSGVAQPTLITSPATRIEMAWMGPVPGAELAVQVMPGRQGYTAEAKLPLTFFDDLKPAPGRAVAADIAANFSDSTGTKNAAKVWWRRGASQILDIPTELGFDRNLWGQGVFRGPGETPIVIDNGNFYVVPAPAAVTVDGDLGDWDLTCAYGPHYVDPALKEQYNITWAAMYGRDALYLGAIFKSARPMENDGGVNNVWWLGDSLEFRLAADPAQQNGDPKQNDDILTFGVWYNAAQQKEYVALQRSFKFDAGDATPLTVRSKAVPGGRSFELRVPWSIVRGGHPAVGQSVLWTMSGIWKNGLRAYGMGSISSFRGMNDWGQAHFLAKGKQPLVFLNLPRAAAPVVAEAAAKYKTVFTVAEKGTLSAGVYTAGGHLVRTLFAGRTVAPGETTVGWDGNSDEGTPAPAGAYQVRAVLNAGLHAQYVTSACSPGKPPHASENPRGGWGGVWGNVIDIASDGKRLYPLWAMEEGDGALLQIDEDANLQWRQHVPLALMGAQTAIASNGKYVFVSVDAEGGNAGKAGVWRVRCDDGAYVPYAHAGNNPLEFYLDGVTRPVPAKGEAAGTVPSAVAGLAADSATLYVAAPFQNQVACFDAESGKALRTYRVEKPAGLCLDGAGALLVVSGQRVLRLDLKSGDVTPVVAAGLDAPWHVAVEAGGSLVVTDRGASQQVKRFARDGKLLAAFGAKGGRDNNGKFEVERLLRPAGIAVAPSGRVFYTEDAPPRIFVRLSPELKYEQLWAGPWYLSGEVTVDPQRPEDLYIWSHEAFIRHKLDYAARTSRPDAVWSDFALPRDGYGRWFPRILHHQGVTYMLCTGTPTTLFRIDGDRVLLVAAVGVERKGGTWSNRWTFADLNENGRVDEGERVVMDELALDPNAWVGSYWGGSIDERNMTMYLLDGRSTQALALTPTFAKPGVPVYQFKNVRRVPLAAAQKPGKQANLSSIWHTPDGGILGNADVQGSDPRGIGHSSHLSDVYVYRLDRDGNLLWRAGKKASGIAKPGEFYGRACGLAGPVAGKFFSFVDENGQDRLYTDDGLYVGSLLEDTAAATPGPLTLPVEHFNSIAYQNAQDQRWYFVAGGAGFASIWEIAGLDKITRLEKALTVP